MDELWQALERFFGRLDEIRRFLTVADAIGKTSTYAWSHAK